MNTAPRKRGRPAGITGTGHALKQIPRLVEALESALAISSGPRPLTYAQRQALAALAAPYPYPEPVGEDATPEEVQAYRGALERFVEVQRIRAAAAAILPAHDPRAALKALAASEAAPVWAREAADLAMPARSFPLTPARIYAVARVLDAYRRAARATIDDEPDGADDAVALLAYLAAPRITAARDRWAAAIADLEARLERLRRSTLSRDGDAEAFATGEALDLAVRLALLRSRRPPDEAIAWAIVLGMRIGLLDRSDLVPSPALDEARLLAEVVATLAVPLDAEATARLHEEILRREGVETALDFPARHYTAPKSARKKTRDRLYVRRRLLEGAVASKSDDLPPDFAARCEVLRARLFDGTPLALLEDTLLLVDPCDTADLEEAHGIDLREALDEADPLEDDGEI